MVTVDQFSRFVTDVHGHEPFPWQTELLQLLVAERRWPDIIDVPTGLGKTWVLDVAVFAAALRIPPARRRVFYVVDRRLVVDEAHQHATDLSDALQKPGGRATVAAVAAELRVSGDDGAVLDVTRMRGGTTWERTWLDRPDRHAIVTGTVDQVGSRLLFRGYGVGERARSIDAALAGTDSLIIVDEAHLVRPFITTATSALAMDSSTIAAKPLLVTMSATTSSAHDGSLVHRISECDERNRVAGDRLRSPKRLRLVEVKTTKANAHRDVAAALADLAAKLAPGRVVGVVVNTVARARAVFDLLDDGRAAVLLTGRSRQVDRDYLLHEHYPRMRAGRGRPDERPFIVVATQTVEVGANIDFDALVTESAPISSLVQRLGRLNRFAECQHAPAPAFVVHDSAAGPDDPVYGPARQATWTWLCEQVPTTRYTERFDPTDLANSLDASPLALRGLTETLDSEQQAELHPTEPYVPELHRSIMDSWTKTSPAPLPDQPVDPFLHGIGEPSPQVTIVWRADLGPSSGWSAAVDALPPVAEEGIEVSLPAARRWLLRRSADLAGNDLEVTSDRSDIESPTPGVQPTIPMVLRYPRRGAGELIPPWRIRPGDTIVVPTAAGGCDDYGWHPESTRPVVDVADLAERRGRPVIRLGPTLRAAVERWEPNLLAPVDALLAQARADAADGNRTGEAATYGRLLAALDPREGTPLHRVLAALRGSRPHIVISPDFDERLPHSRFGLITARYGRHGDDDTPVGSSTGTKQVGLDDHQRAVSRRAHEFAKNLGLSEHLTASVALAARWHDEGKRDHRFQVMLWNGRAAAADIADRLLAKSGMDPTDRAALRRARIAAGYPAKMRHEALSAQVAAHRLGTATHTIDQDLVLHLVASHHGRARPLLPPVSDPDPRTFDIENVGTVDTAQTIDWQHPTRFDALNDHYGRWGLALLETIVRLADIWCSARNDESAEELP